MNLVNNNHVDSVSYWSSRAPSWLRSLAIRILSLVHCIFPWFNESIEKKIEQLKDRSVPLQHCGNPHVLKTAETTKRVVAYYTNWSMYGESPRFAGQIPFENVTDVNYAFMNLSNDGTISLSDPWSDIQYGTDWQNPTKYPYWGNLQQLHQLKLQAQEAGRDLKTYFSIGGWGRNGPIEAMAANPDARKNFIASAISMCETYNFDGIDVDWEYPVGGSNPENFLTLLQELHAAFKEHNPPLNISIATAAGPDGFSSLNWPEISKCVDRINLMTYDYHGSWDSVTNHQSPLQPTAEGDLKFNISSTVKGYRELGADMSKVCLGMPLYFRTYAGATGGTSGSHVYSPYSGPGTGYSPGVKYWNQVQADLQSGVAKGYWDAEAQAFSVYYPATNEFATGVDPQAMQAICSYITSQNLGGAMVWEFKGDDDRFTALQTISHSLGSAMQHHPRRRLFSIHPPQFVTPSAPPLPTIEEENTTDGEEGVAQ